MSQNCSYSSSALKFCSVENANDYLKVIYPWLRIYQKPLPCFGEFPFIPPSNWRNFAAPIKGSQRGFLDESGNSWEWDRLHDNHWDVQHSSKTGDYTNVSPEGVIL
ncbi:polymorphic toxin type 17 domain-containing protein [Leucothrix arctica]|uniref:polymorphic toxin type 17 domain-containing protein n=1 Tax=Leucothrix arctica TaxID=1481894 RepID=UPI001304D77C|nr:polymorphic toxin type 17 domain-containing protein [Leucothrix arctica]